MNGRTDTSPVLPDLHQCSTQNVSFGGLERGWWLGGVGLIVSWFIFLIQKSGIHDYAMRWPSGQYWI